MLKAVNILERLKQEYQNDSWLSNEEDIKLKIKEIEEALTELNSLNISSDSSN